MPYVYILKCADGSYYTGSTGDLERRLKQHQTAYFKKNYTSSRLPVELVWHQEFPAMHDAFVCERQIKGWTRAKKEALIRGEFEALMRLLSESDKIRTGGSNSKDDWFDSHPSTTLRSAQDA